jgi:hypothetical protein
MLEAEEPSEQFACASTKVWLKGEIFIVFWSAAIQFALRFAAYFSSHAALNKLPMPCVLQGQWMSTRAHAHFIILLHIQAN